MLFVYRMAEPQLPRMGNAAHVADVFVGWHYHRDRVSGGIVAQRQAWAWHMGLQRYTLQFHGANLPVILRTVAVSVHSRYTA